MLQFKADPMDYENGNFNHINPVNVEKDPEFNKRLMEYAEKIKPTEMKRNAIHFEGRNNEWKVDEEVLRQYMDPAVFKQKLQAYIAADPALQRDLQMQANYKIRRMDEPAKQERLQNHIANVDEGIKELETLTSERLAYTDAKNAKDIQALQQKYGMTPTGKMNDELKEKIQDDLKDQVELLNQVKAFDISQITAADIVENQVTSLHPLIESKDYRTQDYQENKYWIQFLNHKFTHDENALKRANDNENARLHREAIIQSAVLPNMPGVISPSPVGVNAATQFNMYTKSKEQEKASEVGLFEATKALVPGMTKGALNASTESVYKTVKAIQRLNLESKTPEEQARILSQFEMFKGKSLPQALGELNSFKNAYETHASLASSNASLYKGFEEKGVFKKIEQETDKFLAQEAFGANFMDENNKPLSKQQAKTYLSEGKTVLKSVNKTTSSGMGAGLPYVETLRLNDHYNEFIAKATKEVMNTYPDLAMDPKIQGETFIDVDVSKPYYSKMKTSIIPAMEGQLGLGTVDLLTGLPTTFTKVLGNGKVESKTYAQLKEEPGFDGSKLVISADKSGGGAGLLVSYGAANSKEPVYWAKVQLPPTVKAEMRQIALSQYQTAKQSRNTAMQTYWADYIGKLDNILPFFPYANKQIPAKKDVEFRGLGDTPLSGRLIFNTDASGLNIGNVEVNGKYYLAVEEQDGVWTPFKLDGNYKTSDTYEPINVKAFESEIGSQGAAWRVQGTNQAVNQYLPPTEYSPSPVDPEQN